MKELYPFKMSMNEKIYKDYISHKSVKEIEQNKLEIEIIKKEKYPQKKIREQEIKALNSLKTEKKNEKNYISLINDTNNKKDDYIEIKKRI